MDNIVLHNILVGSVSKNLNKSKLTGKLDLYNLHILSLFGKLLNDFNDTLTLEEKSCLESAIRVIQNNDSTICNYKDNLNTSSITNIINTKPLISDISLNTDELTYLFKKDDFISTYSDVENDLPEEIKILSLPSFGNLKFNNILVNINDVFKLDNINKLLYTWENYTQNTDTIQFQIKDNNKNNPLFSNMATMTINITASVNQPPSQVGSLTINIENSITYTFTSENFTTETTPVYLDPEGDDPNNLQITSLPTSGKLQLDNVDVILNDIISFTDIQLGKLKYIPDSTNKNLHTISFNFSISDEGSNTFTTGGVITVNIAAYVNQAPTTTDNTISDEEGDVYTFSMTDFPSSDPEGDAIVAVRFPTLPSAGNIKLNNVNVTVNQEISSTDVDNNLLTYTQASNAGGTSVNFTFQVKDVNGNWSS